MIFCSMDDMMRLGAFSSSFDIFFLFQQKDSGGGAAGEANKALFLEKVRQSNSACQTGDFERAISLYSEAIAMDKNNHILYSNR